VDRAYEEYCRRADAGEAVDPEAFCAEFPGCEASLRRLLDVHHFLEELPDLLGAGAPPDWPAPGESFLGFDLEVELGRGAFSRVFRAAEPALGGRVVAVKVSRAGAAEAETLGRLAHPNIVPVHSVREDPARGLTAVCMPHLGSATLCDLLDRVRARPGPPGSRGLLREVAPGGSAADRPRYGGYVEAVLDLGARLADALAYAHARGVYHLDLKPSNVLLAPGGRPMLLDFNLSWDERSPGPRLGGTLPYMAPEQLRASGPCGAAAPPPDARADVFALGVILYELLAGRHPFGPVPAGMPTEDLRALLAGRQRRGAPPLRRANPRVGRAEARLVEGCLAADPARRPPAAALAAALRARLAPPARARRWAGAHPWLAATAALLLAAAALAGGHALATRDPYPVRMLKEGRALYRAGRLEEAVERLSRAADADPSLSAARFARGRAYQRLAEQEADPDRRKLWLGQAKADYVAADPRLTDGPTQACLGYCHGQQDLHREAIYHYERALKAGFASPALYNDLGFSRARLLPEYWAQAEDDFLAALEMDPDLGPAHHNLALLYLQRARYTRTPVPAEAAGHVELALELAGPSTELCRDAAVVVAVAARDDPGLVPRALDLVRQAVSAGEDPRRLEGDPAFGALKGLADFREALRAPAPALPTRAARLVDPLAGGAD
jgi:tetratricopeptide (TPR) repeat protein